MNTHRFGKGEHSFDMQGAICLLHLFIYLFIFVVNMLTSVIILCPFQNVILTGVFHESLNKLPSLFINVLISVMSIHFVRIMLS